MLGFQHFAKWVGISGQTSVRAYKLKILIIEDEPGVSDFLEQALQESGYETEVAWDGEQGLEFLRTRRYDLAILDINLPGLDGFGLLKQVRADGISVPIIVLTARGDSVDRVKGLDLGADDYLPKPFELDELTARVRAITRRGISPTLRCDDLSVDTASRRVERGGRPIYLSQTEYRLLERLMRRVGVPVSKTEILRDVWEEDGMRDPNVVEVYIRHLRNKLEAGGAKRLIFTMRGRGYAVTEHGTSED